MLKKIFKSLRKPRSADSPAKAHILDAASHGLQPRQFSRNAVAIATRLQDAGYQAFLVGGCVRDALLGEPPKDFDVATSATPEQVRDLFRGSRIIGRRFKLVHVRHGREIVEVATFRSPHAEDNAEAASDSSGRILRDNVYGTLEEDAQRRDFTINALYYDPVRNQVHAFANGVEDLRKGLLRLIGEPHQRYQEDPVRMLRAARFAAKLGFRMDERTAAPIRPLAHLLDDIPAARLYDEVLKLFMGGYAEATLDQLLQLDLFRPLFPASFREMKQSDSPAGRLIRLALRNTDLRLAEGKPVTPAFLFAALLWPAVLPRTLQLQASGMPAIAAMQKAGQQVVQQQVQRLALPKRFSLPMQEIWALQERLPMRHGKRAFQLVDQPRFRAAYDFLLLREAAGETTGGLGPWWTEFQEVDDAQRQRMISQLGEAGGERRSRKPRKRKPRNRSGGDGH